MGADGPLLPSARHRLAPVQARGDFPEGDHDRGSHLNGNAGPEEMQETPESGGHIAPELIADLAAASRILVAQGVVDAFGHVSMRHPSAPDRYLMARSIAPALVTPDDIIEYDLDSNPCNANGRGSFLERFIHGEIYKARDDIVSIVHSHSASVIPFGLVGVTMRAMFHTAAFIAHSALPSVVPFGLVGVTMRAMFHNAAFIAAGIPVFDIRDKFGATDMLVRDGEKGLALAEAMGSKDVVLMRAHGSVACGPTLQTAVFRAVYTEVNARIQHWTLALGGVGEIAALGADA